MSTPPTLLLAQADSARAIASVYTVSLLATLPLGLAAIALLALRRASAEARGLVWRSAIVALLLVFIGRQLPLQWMAWVVPSFFATPLIALGRMQVNVVPAHAGASEGAPVFVLVLFAVYVGGVIAVLAPIVAASLAARRQLKRALLVRDAGWAALLDDVRETLGIRRSVRVFIDPSVRVPMTWGFVRPVIVLPPAAAEWSVEQRRIVLLHELAHVRASDWLFHVSARLVCALLWFHPGAWWVARGLRDDAELACDDRVIASGVRRSDYAELLVTAADALSAESPGAVPAVALARRRGLRARLSAVLDARNDVRPLAPGWAVLATVVTVGATGPVSVVQLAPTRDVLTSLMHDAQWQSRAYAVLGLAQRADSVAVARAAAEQDPDPSVRAWARYALAQRPVPATRAADIQIR